MESSFIIIWGMHRSGTSLIARALKVFDADLGNNLFAADQGNPKGYFEDKELMNLNEAMLRSLNLSWHSLEPISAIQVQQLEKEGYGKLALDYLTKRAEMAHLVGLKDPRMTKLASFWKSIFQKAAISPYSLVVFRSPYAVAQSLRKRALAWRIPGPVIHTLYSLYLWLDYTAQALHNTATWPRALVDYDLFLSEPKKILSAIGQKFQLAINEIELDSFSEEFIDNSLNHYHNCDEPISLPPKVNYMWRLLKTAPYLQCPDISPRSGLPSPTEYDYAVLLDHAWQTICEYEKSQANLRNG